MTEDQKTRYRKLLSDQKQGFPADFKQFQKEVEEEKKAEKTAYLSLGGSKLIPMEKIDWQAYSPFSITTQDFSDESYAKGWEKFTDYVIQQQGIPWEFLVNENSSYASLFKIIGTAEPWKKLKPLSWLNETIGG